MKFARRARLAAVVVIPAVALAAAAVFDGSATSGKKTSKSALKAALATPGNIGGEAGEVSRADVERYWQSRLTYPTGRFDQRWVASAAKEAKRVKAGIPKGFYKNKRGSGFTALSTSSSERLAQLAAARPLGPQPQESTGCQPPCFTFGLVSGRISAIAFDPKRPHIAYIAQGGGGIWKTTNCCSPATTWQVTTDGASVSTTAVDDVTVDPNNTDVVYAATGDISFGSFSFGSSGILKSTDGGASWTTLATDVFTMDYPANIGGTYPQYQAVTKVRVDPNDSNKVVAGTKTGLFFSYDAGHKWSGPCLTNKFTTQRQDITDLILRDDGSTTSVYAAVGTRGFATYVQQNLGKNGANGIYKLNAIPASGCPAAASWTAQTKGWPAGTASGVACDPPIGDLLTKCETNVARNPGFEAACNDAGTVACDWAAAGNSTVARETDTTLVHSGAGALRIADAVTPGQAQSACTAFSAGPHDASFFYRAALSQPVASVSLTVHFFTDAACSTAAGSGVVSNTAPLNDGGWHEVIGEVSAPAGTSSMRLELSFDCVAGNCLQTRTIRFDDVLVGRRANKLGRIEMAIAPSDPNVLYAEVQAVDAQEGCGVLQVLGKGTSRGCFLGLWRTGDGGATWKQVANHTTMSFLDGTTTAGPCGEDTPQMWYDMGLAVDPNNPDALFLDAIDIWKSTDGGKTLTDVTCGYYTGLNPIGAPVHVDNHVLAYQPGSSTNLLAGNDGGIYVSNNAANAPQGTATGVVNPPTFTDINQTMNTIEFYGGDISANFGTSPNAFIVGGSQDNGSSFYQFAGSSTCPPAGCKWSQRVGGDGMFARIEPKKGERVFMESQNGNLQRSTTGPAGPYLSAVGGWTGDRRSFIFPYEIDKFACPTPTCDRMIAGSYRVWESIDGASSWYPNSPDLTKGTLFDRSFINQLSYAPTTNGNAIVGTNDGNVQYGFGLGTGTPNTATWVDLTGANKVLPNRPIQDVAISHQNALVGYAAVGGFNQNTKKTPGHVFQVTCTTFCNSFTWVDKSGNLPNIPVNSIAINPNIPKQVFAGTDWGLYYTDDIRLASPVWHHFQNNFPNTMIWELSVDRGGTTLAAFTRSRGAWAIPLPKTSASQVTLFADDFETEKGWTASTGSTCVWSKTSDANSPTTAWTTAPYHDFCSVNLDSPAIAVPAGANTIRVTFREKHVTEWYATINGTLGCPCDFGQVHVSTDGGATYTSVGNVFQGVEPAYSQATVPLPDSAAGKTIKIRFHFQADTNTSVPDGGWWVDDVAVTAEPS